MSHISYKFFTKHSGVSGGVYDSLNCSYNVGDAPELVNQNIDIVKSLMGADYIFTLHQIHGTEAHVVDKIIDGNECNQQISADALITRIPKVCIGILTADCAPVLLHERNSNTIAAIHCGWRSTRQDIIKNVISTINVQDTDYFATIGPCAHIDSYEVQQDFVDSIEREYEKCFRYDAGKVFFDLPKYVEMKLIKSGVTDIHNVNVNTVSNTDDYFSFRHANKYTNGICGRQISCIMIR